MSDVEFVLDALDDARESDERDPEPIKYSNKMGENEHGGRNEEPEQNLDDVKNDEVGENMDEKGPNNMADRDAPKLDHAPPNMEMAPLIHQLPIELLTKVIENLPISQWPALESIDRKFRAATLLAWRSLRKVDIEKEFICSKIDDDNMDDWHQRIARTMQLVMKKLYERSPLITSLSGFSFLDGTSSAMTFQYLSSFHRLESIQFDRNLLGGTFRPPNKIHMRCFTGSIRLDDLIQFVESTRSRASLKEIIVKSCNISFNDATEIQFGRLRSAFANDPSRDSLKLESFTLQGLSGRHNYYLQRSNFIDSIDASMMTKLSFEHSPIKPAILTALISRAPELRHIDIALVPSCCFHGENSCNHGRLEANKRLMAALESRLHLTSVGFDSYTHGWPGMASYQCSCQRFETSFLKMLKTIGPRLEQFSFKPGSVPISYRLGEVFDTIAKYMPRLKSMKFCRDYANPAAYLNLRHIADDKNVEEIYFYGIPKEVLDDALPTILSKSIGLKRFDTSAFYRPSQRVVTELCKLSQLVELQIDGSSLTSENLVAFSRVFGASLEVLALGCGMQEGAEFGLIQLIAKCSQLRTFDLQSGYGADPLLTCMAESCPNLEQIRWFSPSSITIEDVQMLVDRCPKLRMCQIGKAFKELKESLKSLKIDTYRKPLWFQ